MPSRDGNHVTIKNAFEREFGVTVVDTSKLGDGVPDLLVGYYGETIWVETKIPPEPKGKRRPSTRCGTCGKTYPSHAKRKASNACASFERVWILGRAGRLSPPQARWQAWWSGCPTSVVLTEADVTETLSRMRSVAEKRS